MGKSYSVNGYINAILRRSEKTLLVEGITDISVLDRLLAENPCEKSKAPRIDNACIFDEPGMADLGNKEKIIYLRQVIAPIRNQFPKLQSIFATMVDREWDGLNFNGVALQGEWSPPTQSDNNFTTNGHSIENYYFHLDCLISYLKHSFPKEINAEFVEVLSNQFSSILAFGVSYSLTAKDFSCIKRCLGLLRVEHIEASANGSFFLNHSFEAALTSRGFAKAADFREVSNKSSSDFWVHNAHGLPAFWLLHGHLGVEAIWSCIGFLASQHGVSEEVILQIVTGRQAERDRFMHSWITNHLPADSRFPLDQAVKWMLTPPVSA